MKINKIISLNDTWGILFTKESDNYHDYYLLIISSETENQPIKLNDEKIPNIFAQIDCVAGYYCLFTSYNDLLWVKINDSTLFRDKPPTNLFPSICFDSARIYTMSVASGECFLVEVKTRSQIKYIVLNTKIDYEDPNSAFGALIIDNNSDDFGIDPFILQNNTIVRILKTNIDDAFYFSSDVPFIPEKSSMFVVVR